MAPARQTIIKRESPIFWGFSLVTSYSGVKKVRIRKPHFPPDCDRLGSVMKYTSTRLHTSSGIITSCSKLLLLNWALRVGMCSVAVPVLHGTGCR